MLVAGAALTLTVAVAVEATGVARVAPADGRRAGGAHRVEPAALFGIGWAISGGCPAIPIIRVGGIRLCRWAIANRLHDDPGDRDERTGSCEA